MTIPRNSTFPPLLPSGRMGARPIPLHRDSSTFRVYFDHTSPHVARLLRRDAALETALRAQGFALPALDRDQDRR